MNWDKLEDKIGEHIPECVKMVLLKSGFETLASLKDVKCETIHEIEVFINQFGKNVINNLNCKHSEFYKNQKEFKFLPGHRALILNMKQFLENEKSNFGTQYHYSLILQKIIDTAQRNSMNDKYHNKYCDIIRFFSTYVFLLCGRQCYEFMAQNLPLPSIKTVLRCIDDTKNRVIEGKFRTDELASYLCNLKTVRRVWIAEDATMVTPKVQYDPATDQLVGLTPPIDAKTGSPKLLNFPATDEKAIRNHLSQPRSRYAYLVMAQPLDDGIPPFVLQLFGTNNCFNASDVLKRWDSLRIELAKNGIELVGVASDGDPRLLAAMSYQMRNLPEKGILVVQDPTHIATKLRNRLLKPDINLPLGKYRIDIGHLRSLVRTVQKSVHGLSMTDVYPVDRMNYGSFEKISDDRVIEALKRHVKCSEATVKYLELSREATSSYLKTDLTPLERVYRIWHAVYFLRIWRHSIKASQLYQLKENFISSNAYMCIEINAQNMILMIEKFRKENKPEEFLTSLFDSQMCENAFRQFRSMGTTEYTKINFSMYELLHMIGRMEVQNDIAYVKLANQAIYFPNKREKNSKVFPLPTDEELNVTLLKAKEEAISEAKEFGVSEPYDIDDFTIQSKLQIKDSEITYNDSSDEESNPQDGVENDDNYNQTLNDGYLCEDQINSTGDEKTAFTTVSDENGIERIVRKSTLLWMLTEPSMALSKDRLRRFQSITNKRRFNEI